MPSRDGCPSLAALPTETEVRPTADHIHGTIPLPQDATVLATLQDGTLIVLFKGIQCRAFATGNGTLLQPLAPSTSILPSQPATQSYTAAPPEDYNSPNDGPFASISSVLADSSNGRRVASQQNLVQENPDGVSAMLRSRLGDIDRYIALYFNRLTQSEHAGLTAERKALVEQLDLIRKRREFKESPEGKSDPFHKTPPGRQGVGDFPPRDQALGQLAKMIDRATAEAMDLMHLTSSTNAETTPNTLDIFENRQLACGVAPMARTKPQTGLSPNAVPFVPRAVNSIPVFGPPMQAPPMATVPRQNVTPRKESNMAISQRTTPSVGKYLLGTFRPM